MLEKKFTTVGDTRRGESSYHLMQVNGPLCAAANATAYPSFLRFGAGSDPSNPFMDRRIWKRNVE